MIVVSFLTCQAWFGTLFIASCVKSNHMCEVENARLYIVEEYKMPIAIEFVPSRRKKVAVDVVPAEWQNYIAQ